MHTARKSYVIREQIETKDLNIEQGGSIKFVNNQGEYKTLDLEALATFNVEDVADSQVVVVSGTLAGVGQVSAAESLALKVDLLISLIQGGTLGDWWTALQPPNVHPNTEANAIGPHYIYTISTTPLPTGDSYSSNPAAFTTAFKKFVDETDLNIV